MKKFLTDISGSGYTFDKTAKTVTLTGIDTLALNQVLAIVNTTRGVTICDCTVPSLRATAISSNVITLNYDTSSQANTDKLLIVLDYAGSTGGLTNTELRATPVPVSVSGVATSAKQDTLDTSINTLLKPASTLSAVTTVGTLTNALPNGTNSIGQVTANAGTNLNTSALALETTLSAASAKLPSSLGAKTGANSLSVVPNSDTAFPISAASLPLPTGAATAANQQTDALTDTQLRASAVPVSATSLPLPLGAATEAKQDTGNTSLATIAGKDFATQTTLAAVNTKLPASVGEKAAASSFPVTLSTENLSDTSVTGQSAQTATVNNILTTTSGTAATDVSQWRSFTVQVVSTASGGTFIFEGSNDNTNFQAIPVYNQALVVRVPIVTAITATSSSIIYEGSCNFRYLRLRIASTITGGSIQAFSTFTQTSFGSGLQVISNGTAANLLATVSATNLSCNVAQMNGVAVTMGNGTSGTGVQRVAIASDNTANSNPWLSTLVPSAAQGSSTTHHAISAATTNATSVKASAGTVHCLQVSNINAAARYLKLYNKASAPTVGTDTPVMTILIPPNSNQFVDTGAYGIRFSTGIAYALTTGITVADTGAVSASEHSVGIFYT